MNETFSLLENFADIGDYIQQEGNAPREVVIVNKKGHWGDSYIGLRGTIDHCTIALTRWNKPLFSKVL